MTGQPALHAVKNRQLRVWMDRLNALMHERVMNEHELDVERKRHTRQIAEIASGLATTAQSVAASMGELRLSKAEQRVFEALAGKLRDQSSVLQRLAEQNQIDHLPSAIHELSTTCTACHALFRRPDNTDPTL